MTATTPSAPPQELRPEAESPDIEEPREEPRRSWYAQVPRDLLLVILGALLALAGEEWRDSHQRRTQAAAALASIRDEIKRNADLVTRAQTHHLALVDTLGKLAKARQLPSDSLCMNGIFNPASVTSIAWQTARETGALGNVPLKTLLALAPAYDRQERYRALSDAMGAEIMADVRRDGMTSVLCTHFAQFIPLDIDFANRESVLLERYRGALAHLDSIH